MLQEFVDVVDELFSETRPPLEKIYAATTDAENFEVLAPDENDRCQVTSGVDIPWHYNPARRKDDWVLMGQKFTCYICGSDEDWHVETDGEKVIAVLCLGHHEPTDTAFGKINTVCSIRPYWVAKATPVKGLEA